MKIIDVVIRASFDKRTKWGPEKKRSTSFSGQRYFTGEYLRPQDSNSISENRAIAGRSKTMRCRYAIAEIFKACAILVPQSEQKIFHT